MRRLAGLAAAHLGLGLLLAVGWHLLAPRAECYVADGACVYQYDQTSSPYFLADATFGGLALLIGLAVAFTLGRTLWGRPLWQLGFAGLAVAAGWLAKTLGEAWNPAVIGAELVGTDALRLRSLPMLYVWPLVVQVVVLLQSGGERKAAPPQPI